MTQAFSAGVMIFIGQFRARWPWSIGVLASWRSMSFSYEVPASSILRISSPRRFVPDCASLCSEHTYSDHSWRCLPQTGAKHRGEGILRMEDAGASEEDDIDSQDSNTPIDHGHLARNCLMKITMPAVKASVILSNFILFSSSFSFHPTYFYNK